MLKYYIFLLLTVSLLLSSCQNTNPVKTIDPVNSSFKIFDDATDVLLSWPKKNTVISHVISEPDNLHPTNGSSAPRQQVLAMTQKTLLYFDYPTLKTIPGLVESLPSISGNELTYTYKLRDDIRWDDGSELISDDIIFTAKALKCPLTNNSATKLYWENIDSIGTNPSNKKIFTVHMKKKYLHNISLFASFIVMQKNFHDKNDVLSGFSFRQFNDTNFKAENFQLLNDWAREFNDDKYGRNLNSLNGLGMYKVQDWESGQYITLVRKNKHWTQRSKNYHEVSYPEKIIYKLNKEETSQIFEFRSQKMDVSIHLSTSSFLKLSSEPEFNANYNSAMLPTFNYTYICFNEKPDGQKRKKLFTDTRIRKALAYITPVDVITKLVYKQYNDQCKRMVSNVSPLKKEFNDKLTPIQYDLNKAENLFAEAGWHDSDNDGTLDKVINGVKISFSTDLYYLSNATEWKDMAMLIMEEYAKAGVKVNPVPLELKLFLEKAKSHDFDLLLGSWGGNSQQEDFRQLWHTSSWINNGSNYSGFGSSISDALIDSMRYETNDSVRYKMSHRLQEIIYDEQPYVFLYCTMRRNVVHKRFANQMIFAEKPGILENMLRLLSITNGITMQEEVHP
jgi:peptide/nickel transport system substrate-binding protein